MEVWEPRCLGPAAEAGRDEQNGVALGRSAWCVLSTLPSMSPNVPDLPQVAVKVKGIDRW